MKKFFVFVMLGLVALASFGRIRADTDVIFGINQYYEGAHPAGYILVDELFKSNGDLLLTLKGVNMPGGEFAPSIYLNVGMGYNLSQLSITTVSTTGTTIQGITIGPNHGSISSPGGLSWDILISTPTSNAGGNRLESGDIAKLLVHYTGGAIVASTFLSPELQYAAGAKFQGIPPNSLSGVMVTACNLPEATPVFVGPILALGGGLWLFYRRRST